ncbi:uncharacterized protein LOC117643574 [Thrips palmi]|uniref:Uncharacterized protein LOC117643574 n=1 Tax=Thrips palmi TaxID=161013 RepID=A0A6P8YFD9_THRPL|nr:uncharacterized protein LOC117643574 [Thrips palmi]
MWSVLGGVLLAVVALPAPGRAQDEQRPLPDYFKSCIRGQPDFDRCVMDALNQLNHLFPTGVPEYNVPPFDPFFAKEIIQKRGSGSLHYKLTLRDVTESGWTRSKVIKFKSDPRNYRIRYTQWWPEKYLAGEYEFDGNMIQLPIDNKGQFNLTLYNFTQTTTVTRRPVLDNAGVFVRWAPMKVQINVLNSGDMALHISHLLGGRVIMENILDRIINAAWRPGFLVLRSTINDLVGTAFTKIFNDGFVGFDLDRILPPAVQNAV